MCNVEDATVRAKCSHSRCQSPTCDGCQRRGSIDRSLEDKPLGGRKKIVITATIAVDRRGKRKREKERRTDEKKKKIGAARDQPSASSCLVEIFFSPQRFNTIFYFIQILLTISILTR